MRLIPVWWWFIAVIACGLSFFAGYGIGTLHAYREARKALLDSQRIRSCVE